jgi:hypothetical protein
VLKPLALISRARRSVLRHIGIDVKSSRPAMIMAELPKVLMTIAERFPREYDENHVALVQALSAFKSQGDAGKEEVARIWSGLSRDILSTPQYLALLFPEKCKDNPRLLATARKAGNRRFLLVEAGHGIGSRDDTAPDDGGTGDRLPGLLSDLLYDLAAGDPGEGPPFLFLSKFYLFRDLCFGYFVKEGLKGVQKAIFHQCYLQRQNWKSGYASDYPYQGMVKLGVSGVKPTEERLAQYAISEFLAKSDQVLDIGSNNGCLALAVADMVGHIDAIEYNPYLVATAHIAADFLKVRNASFFVDDFVEFVPNRKYDAIFSLANHCTIDGNLSMDFEEYVAKCLSRMAIFSLKATMSSGPVKAGQAMMGISK